MTIPQQQQRTPTQAHSYYLQKAQHHIAQAEHWQSIVSRMEAAAAIEAERRNVPIGGMLLDPSFIAARLLDGSHRYKRACAIRNSHQTQAAMYAAAATAARP